MPHAGDPARPVDPPPGVPAGIPAPPSPPATRSAGYPVARRRNWLARADRYAGGLAVDLGLYALSAAFAALTAGYTTLQPHRAWGRIAVFGYVVAAAVAAVGLIATVRTATTGTADPAAPRSRGAGPPGPGPVSARPVRTGPLANARRVTTWLAGDAARAVLVAAVCTATAAVPLLVEAVQRASGRAGRAQEEVAVVELAAGRLVHTGSPYLDRGQLAALTGGDRLLGYVPYQPGMAVFGLPRALAGVHWFTDARVWFALVTGAALWSALRLLRGTARPGAVIRAAQAVTVLPICALTLATGGDDLPVLALCLLALAYAARRRPVAAGFAIGTAAAMKLFAWPILVVLLAWAVARGGRRAALRYLPAAAGLPLLVLVPAFLVRPSAAMENVVRFPLGRGLVTSPAQSPLPGRLITMALPAGRTVVLVLLGLSGLLLAGWLSRRPPRTAAAAAGVSAVGMLVAILLLPSTRFGYLLYPAAFAVWIPALSGGGPTGRQPAEAARSGRAPAGAGGSGG